MLFGQDMATRDPREGSPGPLHDAQSWVQDKTAKLRVKTRDIFFTRRYRLWCGGWQVGSLCLSVSQSFWCIKGDLKKSARTPQRYHRRWGVDDFASSCIVKYRVSCFNGTLPCHVRQIRDAVGQIGEVKKVMLRRSFSRLLFCPYPIWIFLKYFSKSLPSRKWIS